MQPKLQLMQPGLPIHPWATIAMAICEQDQCKYLQVVDYYLRFPVFITLPDTSATTVCEQFIQVPKKYGLSTTIMSDRCSQYTSERFKMEFHNSTIMLKTSSPYHHQTNGVVERTTGTLKALLKKAQQKKKCPYTALWMDITTPKNNDMPSSYELLSSRKPRTMLPTTRSGQCCHSGKETPPKKLTKPSKAETESCRHSSQGKEILNIIKPIYARDTLSNIWITGTVPNRPQSIREPKTYLLNVRGKVYKRTREHLKPRPTTNITNIPRQEILSPAPNTDTTLKKEDYYDGNCKERIKHTKNPAEYPTTARERPSTVQKMYQLQSCTMRSGRVTKITEKFKN